MKVLNPYDIPLNQSALIEASAGTGKTFTITTLYLRAILGLVDESNEIKPIAIDRLLVVTFTEAATQEIKDRIRSKLTEAQSVILRWNETKQGALHPIAPVVEEYIKRSDIAGISSSQALLNAFKVISNSLLLVDEASIFTIHGFCNLCLNRFAFESKISFEQSFEMENRDYIQHSVYDFWRKEVVNLTGIEFNWFKRNWSSPDALFKALIQIVDKQMVITPLVSDSELELAYADYQALLNQVRQQWTQAEFSQVLLNSGLKKTNKAISRLSQLSDYLSGKHQEVMFEKDDGWHYWGSETLGDASNYRKNQPLIESDITPLIDSLSQAHQTLKDGIVTAHWLNKAKSYVETRSQQFKSEKSVLTPDDLLINLYRGIESSPNNRLAEAIASQFPIAMVDEFQDTDAVQYGIFSHIFLRGTTSSNMLMIGDPKQAIYKFRGADIFTYIGAKNALPKENIYTLDTNWRSHPKLVNSVNTLFGTSQFGFNHDAIQFQSVKAGQTDAQGFYQNSKLQCLELNHLVPSEGNSQLKGAEAELYLAKRCATQIKETLIAAQEEQSYIEKSGVREAVKPGDICVLVRTRKQASLIKREMAKLHVDSVFISRDNVFDTQLAKDFVRLIKAIHQPQEEGLVRAALTAAYFNLDITELNAVLQKPALWHQYQDLFFKANELWRKGRYASSVQLVLAWQDNLTRWLAQRSEDTNRLATDFRHLTELIQLKSKDFVGAEKLVAWFESQVAPKNEDAEGAEIGQIRLESDSNLVQIATLHASKGLEYPIVYLPFICEFRASKQAIYHSEKMGTVYRADNRKIDVQRAEQERIAEDVRLLYVALTRPVYKLVVSLYNLRDQYNKPTLALTALAQLLNMQEVKSDEELKVQLELIEQNINSNHGQCTVFECDPEHIQQEFQTMMQVVFNSGVPTSTLAAEISERKVERDWQLWSYSSLVHILSPLHQHEVENELAGLTDEGNRLVANEPENNSNLNPFTFPKGANAGTFLHYILENLEFYQPANEQQQVIIDAMADYGIEEKWLPTLIQWQQQILEHPLAGFSLSKIHPNSMLVEMEFHLAVESMQLPAFGNALSMIGIDINLSNLSKYAEKGAIKGFIDLTFEFEGKYYVLDYKSNYLGDSPTDYNQSNMHLAMSDHNYYLQSLIYVLALHRHLSLCLQDYDFDRHIGGALYMFLRGCDGTSEEQGVRKVQIDRGVIEYLDNALLIDEKASPPPKRNNTNAPQQAFDF